MGTLSSFSKILPPPSLMYMPSVGVDISDTSMKYVSFLPSLREDKFKVLEQWGNIDIPGEVLDRGEIIDSKKLSEVLREFKTQTGAEYIRVSLPEERAYIFETEVKRNVPSKEIRSLLEFRLEENVPISARDAIFDYEIIPSYDDSNAVRVVVTAYQRDTILKYYDSCREAGLTPLAFEVEAQAMARAVIPYDCEDVAMLVDFGKTRTGVGIAHKGSLLYTSTIDIGGGQLSQSLKKVLGDLPEKELTDLKNNFGLIRSLENSDVYDALVPTLSVIKDEIALRMQYWHQKDKNFSAKRRIKKVILCGGSVNLKGLPEYLSSVLNITCVRGNVWQNSFDTKIIVPPIEKRYSYGYATAIGLALKNTV